MAKSKPTQREVRILRSREVCEKISISRATLFRWARSGTFPAPRQLGPQAVGWLLSDVEDWMQELASVEYKYSEE